MLADFRYLSDGTKIGVTDQYGNGYEYLGSLIYRRSPNGLEIESTDFAAGRIIKTSTKYDLRYFVRDYLGSVRAIVNAQGQRLEAIDYMPYGSRWNDPQRLTTDNRFLFNGKEWQPTGDLDVLDYGARQYDPELGRWFNPDPAMQFLNPYTFCGNDPINYIDEDGLVRRLIFDNRNMIITIQATFYHDILSRDYVRAGMEVFHRMKNLYYTDENGQRYKVVFDLNAKRVNEPRTAAENDPSGNYIKFVPKIGRDPEGQIIAGKAGRKKIIVVWDYRQRRFIIAHEMGHVLGAAKALAGGGDNHSSGGLMVRDADDPNASETLDQKSIDEIINDGEGPVEDDREKDTTYETTYQ